MYKRSFCTSRPIGDSDNEFKFDRCKYLSNDYGSFNNCSLMKDKVYDTWDEQFKNCPLLNKKENIDK